MIFVSVTSAETLFIKCNEENDLSWTLSTGVLIMFSIFHSNMHFTFLYFIKKSKWEEKMEEEGRSLQINCFQGLIINENCCDCCRSQNLSDFPFLNFGPRKLSWKGSHSENAFHLKLTHKTTMCLLRGFFSFSDKCKQTVQRNFTLSLITIYQVVWVRGREVLVVIGVL